MQERKCRIRVSDLVYRNFRIIATNRRPPPASDQGKQPLRSSERSGNPSTQPDSCQTTQPNARQVYDEYPTQLRRHRHRQTKLRHRRFVFVQDQKTETNNTKGIAHTVEYLKKHNVALVVMESTGGLEVPAAKAIHRAGIAVIIANPRQTHQFAQSQSLTKTDAKDAKMPPSSHR